MTDDEQKVARDKEAIDAMKNAKANMATAISRIEALEKALSDAVSYLRQAKGDISAAVYCYPSDRARTVHQRIDDQIALLGKVL